MLGNSGVLIARRADPAAVDIASELAAIRAVLASLASEHARKISRALDDAEDEANKRTAADRDELGNALARGLGYARSAAGYTTVATQLAPHLRNAVAWLGDRWHALLTNPGSCTDQLRGADLVVSLLAEAGVEYVFGRRGPSSPLHDALVDSPIRMIATRHEAGAMFAAAGHAHATGALAVVAVASSADALDALTGLASAWCDGLPVMLLVGDAARVAPGGRVLQDGSVRCPQVVEMARAVTKLSAEISRPGALPHLVRRAIAIATSGKPGPVLLALPFEVATAMVHPPRVDHTIAVADAVAPEILDELIELLAAAERPLILAGSGVRGGDVPARLRVVAERLRCPVATTPKAKGVFPEDHPLALGVLGIGGHPSARAYLEPGCDVVIAIGTSLGDLATDGFTPNLRGSRALVHVDIDARQIGRSYEPTHAVVAPAAALLGGLTERLDAAPRRVPPRELAGAVERLTLASSITPGRIASHDAVREIQRTLPGDTIFTVDSGEHFLFAVHYLETRHPDGFVVMTGLGSMGQSIGAAIGARLAHPTRTVAAICGDGCFAMNAFEIATAVAERIPIRVFVFNDGVLGMVEKGHEKVFGRKAGYPTGPAGPLDVCAIARGLGATALRIDDIGQLAAARQLWHDAPGPVVADVRIDPAIVMKNKDRVSAMAPAGAR
jgi:acetolactate synthase-1/2/3 large subunit